MPIPPIAMAAAAAAPAIIGAFTGESGRRKADKRQFEQQKKLQRLQVEGQKELGEFNQGLALDMWEKTNYKAQVAQLEKAGLNTGLMYEGGGAGGTTSGGQAGNVSGAMATSEDSRAMGIQLGLQAAAQMAQIELTKAQTDKTKVETEKTEGVDTAEAESRIEKLKQDTANAAIQGGLTEYQKQIAEVEANVAKKSEGFQIQQMWSATDKLIAETESAKIKAKIDQGTVNNVIHQIKQNTTEQSLRITLQRANIKNVNANTAETKAKIEKIAAEIIRMAEQTAQGQEGLDQNEQRIILEQIRTEFGAGDEARVIRWIQTTGEAIKDIRGIGKKTTKTRTDKGEDWSETTTTHN